MNLLEDAIVYFRRIVKSTSNADLSDDLVIDYLNRFITQDVPARVQLWDFKTTYQLQTVPGFDKYNMPLYDVQAAPGGDISFYPVYTGFIYPTYVQGIPVPLTVKPADFYAYFPNYQTNSFQVATGDGGTTYSFTLPILGNNATQNPPFNGMVRGHVNTTGIIATGVNEAYPQGNTLNTSIPVSAVQSEVFINTQDANNNPVQVRDSGQFLDDDLNYGLLMSPGNAPLGNASLGSYTTTSNTVNYETGEVNVQFPVAIPSGNAISVQARYFVSGRPVVMMFYDNTLTLRPTPDRAYLVELTAFLSPAAFLSGSNALPFAYMTEYFARGAAQKFLSDIENWESYNQYMPLFKEQERLAIRRSDREFQVSRKDTVYSSGRGVYVPNIYGGNPL